MKVRLCARPSCRVSEPFLSNAYVAEWAHIPTATLQNLVESLSKYVEAVIGETVGPSPY